MWHKIQPGPIWFSTWAEPIKSAFFIYFFLWIFGRLHGPSPTIRPFNFLGHGPFADHFVKPFCSGFPEVNNVPVHYYLGRSLFRAHILFGPIEHLVFLFTDFQFTHLNNKHSIILLIKWLNLEIIQPNTHNSAYNPHVQHQLKQAKIDTHQLKLWCASSTAAAT